MTTTTTPQAVAQRDDDFYLQNAIFQVEDRLFKVPILNFTLESEVFQAMFQLPQDPEAVRDGSTDEQPIRLDDIKKEDFKQLLRVMYAQSFTAHENLTESEWTSVLVLSARWEMDRLRNLAIEKLTPYFATDPHKLVVMGRKYNIDAWLTSGIHLLILRKGPMEDDDADKIGPSDALKVAALREWTLQWKIAHRDSTEWILNRRDMPPTQDVFEKIMEVFYLRESE